MRSKKVLKVSHYLRQQPSEIKRISFCLLLVNVNSLQFYEHSASLVSFCFV